MNPTDPPIEPSPTCCPAGNCGEIPRRDFVRALTLGAAAAAVPALPVMAGPFETTIQEAAEQEASEQRELVPADKKLDPQWVKSLFERGTREVYRGKDLEKIGMPIGGISPANSTWVATANSGTGIFSTRSRAPATITMPFRRCPLRRWNRGSPSRSRPAQIKPALTRPAQRSNCGLWIVRASLTSPSAASIRSRISSTAIPSRPSACRSRPSRHTFPSTCKLRACRRP